MWRKCECQAPGCRAPRCSGRSQNDVTFVFSVPDSHRVPSFAQHAARVGPGQWPPNADWTDIPVSTPGRWFGSLFTSTIEEHIVIPNPASIPNHVTVLAFKLQTIPG